MSKNDEAVTRRETMGNARVLQSSASDSGVNPPCARCGGPHPFDTSVPSVVWNATIRSRGLPEYLCLTCIVEAFCCFGDSFTATLWGGPFQGGCPIEVRIRDDVATDAARLVEENSRLRAALSDAMSILLAAHDAACRG